MSPSATSTTSSSAPDVVFPILKTPVGRTGLGLMGLTWTPTPVPDSVSFPAIKLALSSGAYLNSADIYGPPDDPTANLSLISRFFAAHPSLAANAVLGVKGGLDKMKPRCDAEYLAFCIQRMNKVLGSNRPGTVIFIPARVDRSVPIETVMSTLAKHVESGEIQGIGLCEVSAATIRAAHAVHPISCVEIEVSLMSQEALNNGVADTCRELGIPITAYSPLGRGILAGRFAKSDKPAEGDFMTYSEWFRGENFDKNVELGEEVKKVAAREGVTAAQLMLAWVKSRGDKGPVGKGRLTIVPIPGATNEVRVKENLEEVEVKEQMLREVEGIVQRLGVSGLRYNTHMMNLLYV